MMPNKTFIATTSPGLTRATVNGDGHWAVERILPDNDVRCLAADPHQPGVVYAGTQGQGVWRSTDRGQSWAPLGLEGIIVKSLALSPTEPGHLYAGTKSPATIYASHDGGEHWHELASFREIRGRRLWFSPAEPPFSAYVQAISVSPDDPNHLVAGIEFGAVVRSEDGGRTWSNHLKGSLRDCHSLTFHSTNGQWVYEAGGTGAGGAVSRDGGRTWQQSKAGLDRHYGWACAADPTRPEVWYISVSPSMSFPRFEPAAHVDGQAQACIFRASGGGRWEKLAGGLPQPLDYMPYTLLTDPEAPGHLYAGLSNGDIWHTADYGDTWQQLPVNLGGIHRVMISL